MTPSPSNSTCSRSGRGVATLRQRRERTRPVGRSAITAGGSVFVLFRPRARFLHTCAGSFCFVTSGRITDPGRLSLYGAPPCTGSGCSRCFCAVSTCRRDRKSPSTINVRRALTVSPRCEDHRSGRAALLDLAPAGTGSPSIDTEPGRRSLGMFARPVRMTRAGRDFLCSPVVKLESHPLSRAATQPAGPHEFGEVAGPNPVGVFAFAHSRSGPTPVQSLSCLAGQRGLSSRGPLRDFQSPPLHGANHVSARLS